jgi:hypothetical protein
MMNVVIVQKCTRFVNEEQLTMQISRHWRLNSQRYRLQGVRYDNGTVSLQNRPQPLAERDIDRQDQTEVVVITQKIPLKAAS